MRAWTAEEARLLHTNLIALPPEGAELLDLVLKEYLALTATCTKPSTQEIREAVARIRARVQDRITLGEFGEHLAAQGMRWPRPKKSANRTPPRRLRSKRRTG